jgi:hypothetical protein
MMEKIGADQLVKLADGKQYLIGATEVTRYDEEDGEEHHFCVAIACGTSDLISQGKIDKTNKEDVYYTILEYWEEQNPDTGEPNAVMRVNEDDITIYEELFG